jgi:hypothetical protein
MRATTTCKVVLRIYARKAYRRKRGLDILIYLLTAIGLPPDGSNTVHIYTQTIHRTAQNKQYIEQHKIFWKSSGRAPSLRVIPWHLPYNWGKARKNLSQGIALIILNPDTRWRWAVNFTPRPLYPPAKNFITHWIKSWVVPDQVRKFWRRQYL